MTNAIVVKRRQLCGFAQRAAAAIVGTVAATACHARW